MEKSLDSMADVTIRPIEPRDAPQAARLWVDGLQQTVDAAPTADKRDSYAKFFRECAEKECAEGGGVGIGGRGLIDFYNHPGSSVGDVAAEEGEDSKADPHGREARMFVAVDVDGVVLGMVGVKRGMDDKEFPQDETSEDYSTFSIWKMSVATNGRRSGIGKRLMIAVEEWVRSRPNAEEIRLYTANPIAASFYTSEKIGFVVAKKTDHYGIYEKKLSILQNN